MRKERNGMSSTTNSYVQPLYKPSPGCARLNRVPARVTSYVVFCIDTTEQSFRLPSVTPTQENGEQMDDINSLLELERLEQRAHRSANAEHNVEDENDRLLLRDISEQLIGDMVGHMLASIKGVTKGCKDSDLCGGIDMEGEEETSTVATSLMDKLLDGDDDDDDGGGDETTQDDSDADSKIPSTKIDEEDALEVTSQNANKEANKKGKRAWKKIFRRRERKS